MQLSAGLPGEFKALARKMPVFVAGADLWSYRGSGRESCVVLGSPVVGFPSLCRPVQSLSAVKDVPIAVPELRERPPAREPTRTASSDAALCTSAAP